MSQYQNSRPKEISTMSLEHVQPFLIFPPQSLSGSHLTLDTIQVIDWLQSLKQFFINVSYHIFVASLTLMTPPELDLLQIYDMTH